MTLTVVVTRNVPDRLHGFLKSCMVELSAGVYITTFLGKRARDLVWAEIEPFGNHDCSVVMVSEDQQRTERCQVRSTGTPTRTIAMIDGMLVSGKPAIHSRT